MIVPFRQNELIHRNSMEQPGNRQIMLQLLILCKMFVLFTCFSSQRGQRSAQLQTAHLELFGIQYVYPGAFAFAALRVCAITTEIVSLNPIWANISSFWSPFSASFCCIPLNEIHSIFHVKKTENSHRTGSQFFKFILKPSL